MKTASIRPLTCCVIASKIKVIKVKQWGDAKKVMRAPSSHCRDAGEERWASVWTLGVSFYERKENCEHTIVTHMFVPDKNPWS